MLALSSTVVFDEEEKFVLNYLGIDESQSTVLEKINTGIVFCDDPDVVGLLEGLLDKVFSLSAEEWEVLQGFLPFSLTIPEVDDEPDFDFE